MKLIPLVIALCALLLSLPTQASLCEGLSKAQGKFYVGPSLLIEQISASGSRFRGIHPRISLGYIDISNRYFFGTEIFTIPATLSLSSTRKYHGRSAKDSSTLGFSLLPGARLYKDYYGYARFGIVTTKFTVPNASALGIQGGLGIQKALDHQWQIRGEYVLTSYNSVSELGNPTANEIGVGLIYLID